MQVRVVRGVFGGEGGVSLCATGWGKGVESRGLSEVRMVIWVVYVVLALQMSCFLRVGHGAGTVAVSWGRGGAMACPRGAHVVALLGALNFAGSTSECAPWGRVRGADFWCHVSARSRNGRYAKSRLAAVVSVGNRRAHAVARTGACITDLNCSQL